MNEERIRSCRPEDRPALKALWKQAFGDEDAYIDRFFDSFPPEGTGLAAEAEGKPVSAMYPLSDIRLYPYRQEVLTAGYAYALATLPEYRGRGIGRRVYRALSDRILETCDAACVLPAEESLYPFYETAAGAKVLSYVREVRVSREELRGVTPCPGARLPAYQYAGVRQSLLAGMPHAALSEAYYDFLEADEGTEFFVLEGGVAATETPESGVCRITELLAPDADPLAAIAGVARWQPAREYIVRTPLFYRGLGDARPYMLAVLAKEPDFPMPRDLWWGFGLD